MLFRSSLGIEATATGDGPWFPMRSVIAGGRHGQASFLTAPEPALEVGLLPAGIARWVASGPADEDWWINFRLRLGASGGRIDTDVLRRLLDPGASRPHITSAATPVELLRAAALGAGAAARVRLASPALEGRSLVMQQHLQQWINVAGDFLIDTPDFMVQPEQDWLDAEGLDTVVLDVEVPFLTGNFAIRIMTASTREGPWFAADPILGSLTPSYLLTRRPGFSPTVDFPVNLLRRFVRWELAYAGGPPLPPATTNPFEAFFRIMMSTSGCC